MNSSNSKLVASIFILVIFVFGAGTVLKCTDTFAGIVKEKRLLSSKTEIEEAIQANFKSHDNWINLNGLFQRTIGTTIIKNPENGDADLENSEVYKLDNGQIMYSSDKKDVKYYASQITKLSTLTQERGIDFLYVQIPFKIQNDEVMPVGTKEYGNENADELIKLLKEKQVSTLDIREKIEKNGYKYEDLFFNTDHHWKPSAGLWAAGQIAEALRERYKVRTYDYYYDINNYEIKTYKDWFLGSLGKKTGAWYAGVDDFDVIAPNFNTNFDFWAKTIAGDVKREGTFEETMFDWDKIETKDFFDESPYAGYIGGDFPINIIQNKMAPNKKKVLLVRDSFSCVLLPYLSLSAETITAIDARHYRDMSVSDYIKKHQNEIDIVLIAYSPNIFSEISFESF